MREWLDRFLDTRFGRLFIARNLASPEFDKRHHVQPIGGDIDPADTGLNADKSESLANPVGFMGNANRQ